MKKISFLLLIIVLIMGFGPKDKKKDQVRETPKFKTVTPGGLWLKDSLFIDQTEVRNCDWLEYMYWTEKADSANYKNILPDTQCWARIDTSLIPYVKLYLRHPSYREYPVVGITFQQALDYCKWRTDRVNEYILVKEKILNYEIDIEGQKKNWKILTETPPAIKYRLPTEKEWEYAAQAGLAPKYNMGYESILDKQNRPFLVTKEYNTLYKTNDIEILEPVGERGKHSLTKNKPNKYGVYNMMSNVSEFVADSSIVKGLNFDTYIENNSVKTQFPNVAPSAKIGFRCIAEVLR